MLVRAVEKQEISVILQLARQGVNLDCTVLYSKTPLTHAIELGHVNVAKQLVISGAEVNLPEMLAQARRPLHLAVTIGSHELLLFLLQKGAAVDGQDGCGVTPLHQASFLGDFRSVEVLLAAGATIRKGDSVGRTAFHRAVEGNHFELADFLLSQGADINAVDNLGWTALYQCIVFCQRYNVKYLLTRGASPNGQDYKGESPLVIACDPLRHGNIYTVLSSAMDFYKRVKKIPTPALQSLLLGERECSNCELKIVHQLIRAGADVSQAPVRLLGQSPHCSQSRYSMIRYLVLCGSRIQADDLDNKLFPNQTEKFRKWLQEQFVQQISLQRLCRTAVRGSLRKRGRDIQESVNLLPVPQKMKQFLNVSEFWAYMSKNQIADRRCSVCSQNCLE